MRRSNSYASLKIGTLAGRIQSAARRIGLHRPSIEWGVLLNERAQSAAVPIHQLVGLGHLATWPLIRGVELTHTAQTVYPARCLAAQNVEASSRRHL